MGEKYKPIPGSVAISLGEDCNDNEFIGLTMEGFENAIEIGKSSKGNKFTNSSFSQAVSRRGKSLRPPAFMSIPQAVRHAANNYHNNYHITKTYIDSSDNSSNSFNHDGSVLSLLGELKLELLKMAEGRDQAEALDAISEIEIQLKSESPKLGVVKGLLKSLPAIESVAAIGASIMSTISSGS